MYRIFVIFTLTIVLNINLKAQYWQRNRQSLVFGLGTSQFMGDLGGGAKDAAHFLGLRDMNLASTRPVLSVGYRYRVLKPLAVKGGVSWAILAADDKNSRHIGRKLRNLHFRSHLFSAYVHGEYYFLNKIQSSGYTPSYKHGWGNFNAYLFAGVSFNLFNPKAKLDGKWHALQPLCTEGQGIDGNRAPYKKWAIGFPIGLGMKYYLGGNLLIGIEFSNTYTTSDYIDDAHDKYFDNNKIRTHYGDIAAQLADRHLNSEGNPHITPKISGQKMRGNPDYNDAFIFTVVTLTYNLRKDRRGLPKYN